MKKVALFSFKVTQTTHSFSKQPLQISVILQLQKLTQSQQILALTV